MSTVLHDYWLWDFGDTETSNLEYPPHHNTAEGPYTVSLYISSSSGTTHGETVKTDYIRVIPEGSASFTANIGSNPLNVQFTDASTGFIEPISYSWDFGDGGKSTERNPTHLYSTYYPTQDFQVTLTVNGYCDETDAMTQTITVTNSVLEFYITGRLIPGHW